MIYFIREHKDKLNGYSLEKKWLEYINNPNRYHPFSAHGDEYIEDLINIISFQEYLSLTKTPEDSFFYIFQIRDPYIAFHADFNILDYIDNKDIISYLQTGEIQILVLLGLEEFNIFNLDYVGVPRHDVRNFYEHTPIGLIECHLNKYNIPTKHFHYASPLYKPMINENIHKLKTMGVSNNFNFYMYDSFINQYSDLCNYYNPSIDSPIDVKTTKLYSCLNYGIPKKHRSEMVYQLWKNDLLEYGNVSLKETLGDYDVEFTKLLPLKLDGKVNHHYSFDNNLIIHTEKELLDDTFIYISCETHLEGNVCYITEKTWKAILHKKPFFIIGDNGSLAKLRDMGFRTFDKWWNEDYDYYDDNRKIEFVIYVLKKLAKKSPSERKLWFDACGDINEVLDHNYKTLKSYKDKMISEFLEQLQDNYQATSP